MLQKQNNRCDGNFSSKGADKGGVDSGLPDVLEASGDSLEDLDRVGSLGGPSVAGVQPGSDGHDEDHKCVPEDRHEEEYAGPARESLPQPVAEYPDPIQSN